MPYVALTDLQYMEHLHEGHQLQDRDTADQLDDPTWHADSPWTGRRDDSFAAEALAKPAFPSLERRLWNDLHAWTDVAWSWTFFDRITLP